jgi:hypothetical protein
MARVTFLSLRLDLMATYPSFKQLVSASRQFADERTTDFSVLGEVHSRLWYPTRLVIFNFSHILERADLAQLVSFYDTNRMVWFDFEWQADGQTYSCVFVTDPAVQAIDKNLASVDVKLRERG